MSRQYPCRPGPPPQTARPEKRLQSGAICGMLGRRGFEDAILQELTITREDLDEEISLLTLRGPLAIPTFLGLEDDLADLFEEERFRLLVDLAGVNYISSTGVGVFINAQVRCQENGGNLVLVSPTTAVNRIFDVLGLTQAFTIVKDREAALAALR